MKTTNTTAKELYYQKIAGPLYPFCDNAMVHFEDIGGGRKKAYINAYLPTLVEDKISIGIHDEQQIKHTEVERQLNKGPLMGTLITITYKSQKGTGSYFLWQIGFTYESKHPVGVEDVVLVDTDPETSRGTVTTVKDPGT
ncbi:hypothetical protein [Marinoscillum sp.]|uniref:hypothetical protein n=1 Tax=Marinoscillum sp. TaxID=2024838 RepID=UPI003BA9EC1F